MKFLREFVSCVRCFFNRRKVPKVKKFSFMSYHSNPFFIFFVPIHSFMSCSVIRLNFVITCILWSSSFPQISSTVIQRVPVAVVGFLSWFTPENFSSHINCIPFSVFAILAHGIKAFGFWTPMGAPIPLVEPRIVGSSNHCVLPLRKRDDLVRWVLRLDDRVAFHVAGINSLWHRFTSNGPLLPAASLAQNGGV